MPWPFSILQNRFIRKLPGTTPEQYKAFVAGAPADHDAMMKDMPATHINMPTMQDTADMK